MVRNLVGMFTGERSGVADSQLTAITANFDWRRRRSDNFSNYSQLNCEQITNPGEDSFEVVPFDFDVSGKFYKA